MSVQSHFVDLICFITCLYFWKQFLDINTIGFCNEVIKKLGFGAGSPSLRHLWPWILFCALPWSSDTRALVLSKKVCVFKVRYVVYINVAILNKNICTHLYDFC